MEDSTYVIRTWARIAVITGLLTLFAYFFSIVFKFFPPVVGRLLFFSIGPLSIVSIFSLYKVLCRNHNSIPLQLGTLFHIIAGAIMNMMAVVQATQFTTLGEQINTAQNDTQKEILTDILWGVNVVQSGLDISWDIFISVGTILLGFALINHPMFGKFIGVLGMVIASLALIFNLLSFPIAPADSGLIDLGPAVGLWYAVVIILFWKALERK